MQAGTDQHQVDHWYTVDISERGGLGVYSCRAPNADAAMSIAFRTHAGTGCTPIKAEFDNENLNNIVPDSFSKTYRGVPFINGSTDVYMIHENGIIKPLDPRLDLANHSPTGFAWGYEGSGPSQLALALLADALGDDERALQLYQPFRRAYIAPLDIDRRWSMSASVITGLAATIEYIIQGALLMPDGTFAVALFDTDGNELETDESQSLQLALDSAKQFLVDAQSGDHVQITKSAEDPD